LAALTCTGWDCHAHVFGPYDRFPLAALRSYTPHEAPIASYLALLDRLGLSHGVLVHPSAYGDDASLLLDVLAHHDRLRGVVVLRAEQRSKLTGLRQRGVRAARFSHRRAAGANFSGSASFADLQALAPALADEGLHAELWTDCDALPELAPLLRELPVPVVIDHMGGFDAAAGVKQPGFRLLLELVARGGTWVKLCAYRNLMGHPDLEAGRHFHEALLAANPERLLWGSDWPHLRVEPVPDAAVLLATFRRWTGSDSLARQVLVTNPVALYA